MLPHHHFPHSYIGLLSTCTFFDQGRERERESVSSHNAGQKTHTHTYCIICILVGCFQVIGNRSAVVILSDKLGCVIETYYMEVVGEVSLMGVSG